VNFVVDIGLDSRLRTGDEGLGIRDSGFGIRDSGFGIRRLRTTAEQRAGLPQ